MATIEALAKHGATIDATCLRDGRTAFHVSCASGLLQSAQALLRLGCDRTVQDKEGSTGEDQARARGHTAIVEMIEAAEMEEVFSAEGLQVPDTPVAQPRAASPVRARTPQRRAMAA